MDSPINAEQRQWLTLMDSSAHALLNMLNDVLDFSRIEAGKMGIERVRFDLPRLLEETGALYEGQAREKAIQWTQSLAPDLPSAVTGDPGRLRQVLGNLLSNALKFTPAGGHVRLSASTGTDQGGGRVLRLRVQDDGVGIARAHQAKIFEAFTQADSSTARRFGGSGLGLAICARLVRLMGGHIDLDSEPGRGSVFTVTLPLDGTDPASGRVLVEEGGGDAAAMQATGKRFDGKVVLVAEDNPVNELLINQWLQRLGCVVRNARDGEEALAQWEAGPVDLVLMDVQMPRVNGLEAVRRIRERERRALRRPTPVVALTANAMSGDREACLAAGMDAYLSKPVTPESLAQAMAQVLRQDAVGGRAPAAGVDGGRPAPPGPIDVDKLRRRLDGDEATLRHLAQAMRSDISERMKELHNALQQRDQGRAIAHAHGFTGSLGSMTAERGARLAKGLELAARTGDWPLFGRALPLLQSEVQRIDAELAVLLDAPVAGG